MALAARTSAALATRAAARVGAARPVLPVANKAAVSRAARAAAPARRASSAVTKALPMEVATVAGEAGFIGGVALTMAAITLVGLAIGFVLLRVESLAEEGKL